MKVYLIGALKNQTIPALANALRADGHTVYDDWWSAGERADTCWREHEQVRGRSFKDAIKGEHAQAVLKLDKKLLDQSDAAVLVCPAGKSAHVELGYMVGKGKRTAVLMDEPDRYDVMLGLADTIVENVDELRQWLHERSIDKPHCPRCGHVTWLQYAYCRPCLNRVMLGDY